jgi:predicted small integral membrane protein
MMEWMAWTIPTALFFVAIGLILVGMTTWELRSPSILRRGFLPIATTRGDRLFIGLLGSAYLHLLVIGVTDWSIWVASRCPWCGCWCDAVGLVESLGNVLET